MAAINQARLYFYSHTAAGYHAKDGSVPIVPWRKLADWSEASAGPTGTDEVWDTGTAPSPVRPRARLAVHERRRRRGRRRPAFVYITEIVQAWFGGAPNYGLALTSGGAASASRSRPIRDGRRGRVPYIWIDYTTNTPPNAPTGLSPTGDQVTQTGRTIPLPRDYPRRPGRGRLPVGVPRPR